jgi:uncharacterized protein DUF4154
VNRFFKKSYLQLGYYPLGLWARAVTTPLLFLILLVSTSLKASTIDEGEVLAALTLNVIKFATWPSEIEGKIKLCVLGDDTIISAFLNQQSVQINGRQIKIITVRSLVNITNCNVIFISQSIRDELYYDILSKVSNNSILTIANFIGHKSKTVMVDFYPSKQKRHRLQVNIALLRRADITLSSRILKLATIIDFEE